MKFEYLRNLLEKARLHLSALFEQGFSSCGATSSLLKQYAEEFSLAGLETGASLFLSLESELTQARSAVGAEECQLPQVYAQLWSYLAYSKKKLEYLEVEERFGEEVR